MTSYIDASEVYGGTKEMADKLRTLSNGIYNVSLFSSSLLKRKKKDAYEYCLPLQITYIFRFCSNTRSIFKCFQKKINKLSKSLRTFSGLMVVKEKNLLPRAADSKCIRTDPTQHCFLAGKSYFQSLRQCLVFVCQ